MFFYFFYCRYDFLGETDHSLSRLVFRFLKSGSWVGEQSGKGWSPTARGNSSSFCFLVNTVIVLRKIFFCGYFELIYTSRFFENVREK